MDSKARRWRLSGTQGRDGQVRQGSIALALSLGGALTIGLLLWMSSVVWSAPPAFPAPPQDLPASSDTPYYNRVQTVTLHAPPSSEIYATAFTTTFQTWIMHYQLGGWLRLPHDAVTRTASCIPTDPPTATCKILWGTHVVTFAGTGWATIYLEYDTWSRAWRDPGTRGITLTYPVGSDEYQISLTNTVVFSRSFHPLLELVFVTPTSPTYDEGNCVLRWCFTNTPRLEFTVAFTEPLLGANLRIDRLEMSDVWPEAGEHVRYTATLRNVGSYGTGRAVLTELFVRPLSLGPPTVLTDHVGGWLSYAEDALFRWIEPGKPPISWTYWWAGLEPGGAITGTTVLTWPDQCAEQACGVWAKVDPTYLDLGIVYEWYGYNPEGLECGLDDRGFPTCEEENDNIAGAKGPPTVYLPLVLRKRVPEFKSSQTG